jgi:hypothetical protein
MTSVTSAAVSLAPAEAAGVTYEDTLLAADGPYAVSEEVLDILGRMAVRPEGTVIYRLTQLIDTLKAAGIWQVMDVFSIYALHHAQASGLNLIDVEHKATFVGAPTWAPFQGFAGNGIDAALEHEIDFAGDLPHVTAENHSLWVWCLTDLPGATIEVGANGGGSQLAIRVRSGTDAGLWSCNEERNDVPVVSGRGFTGLSRTSPSAFLGFKNATATAFTRPAGVIPTSRVSVLRIGAGATFSPNQIAFWAIGGGLSAEQGVTLYEAMRTFLAGVGAIDPNETDDPEAIGENHFTAAMIHEVTPDGLIVEQQAPAPASNAVTEATYPYFPLSASTSQNAAANATSTWDGSAVSPPAPTARKVFVFTPRRHDDPNQVNRRPWPPYPRIFNSSNLSCQFEFPGGLAKAMAAEEAQVMFACGYPKRAEGGLPGYLDVLDAAGFVTDDSLTSGDCRTRDAWAADADALFPHDALSYSGPLIKVAHDKVWLPQARLADMLDAYGIWCDMEPHDGRGPAETKAHILKLAERCAALGYGFDLYTNALNAGTQIANGLGSSNLADIVNDPNVSRLSVQVCQGNAATPAAAEATILAQLALLKGPSGDRPIPYGKLTMVVGIGASGQELPLSSAEVVRAFIEGRDDDGTPNPAKAFGAVDVWRNGGIAGGEITRPFNQVMATVLGLPTA